ncbi:MAG: ABC transporter permease, partial [Myxococcota bacterium]
GDLGGGLDPQVLEDLGRLDGVKEVYPVVGARVPLRAEGGEGFIGRRLRTDVFATGVPLSLVRNELGDGQSFEDDPEGPVPVIVARRLMDLYNSTVAPALQKPKLSERMVIGFEFVLQLGRSATAGIPDPAKVKKTTARIVGLSDRASLAGITIPEATARRWNQEYGFASPLTGAWVELEGPGYAGPVSSRIEQRGLRVDDTPKLVGAALTVGAGLVGLFALLLLALSAFAIAQTFFLMVAERRSELAILRALGAKRGGLGRLVLTEAAIVGAVGSVVGVAAGAGLALALDVGVRGALPDLPLQPEALVHLSPALMAAGLILGVSAAVLGAAFPALRASRADPARALRS